MLYRVKSYIEKQNLPLPSVKIIVGVSGGVDSVVLLNVLHQLGYECLVAHCNFHLRGEESLRDELFVQQLCEEMQVPFHKKDFDTNAFANEHQLSIEMAARELRYDWFELLRQQEGAEAIAVGHQLDDMVETFLMNLTRGTGIQGLTGIKACNGSIIRPLLDITREEIENYANENRLPFVLDSSNAEYTYTRNKYRHAIIPLLKEINPSFLETMKKNLRSLNEVADIYRLKIEEIASSVFVETPEETYIDLQKLSHYPSSTSILYELLLPYHFSSVVVQEISESFSSTSGKLFFSPTHRVIKDRDRLIITPLEDKNDTVYLLEQGQQELTFPCRLCMEKFTLESDLKINKDKRFAYIDNDVLAYPLQLRKWQKGDTFYPFGMDKKKKLSDFFIDNKFSLSQKEQIWILLSRKDIVWVVGERLDNRFKITSQTTNVLKIEFF